MSSSHVQRSIISRLKNADSLRYSELLAGYDDRDLFNYHLRELVAKGLVTKLENKQGYTLSGKGLRQVADVHHTSDQANRLFKINPLLIVAGKRADGLYILQQLRTAQPDYGIIGIPGGTITKAEPLLIGASRKLKEETGLDGEFSYVCTTRRILYQGETLFADVLFPICIATAWSGDLHTTEFGKNNWYHIDEAIKNDDRIELVQTTLRALRDDTLSTVQGRYHEQISHI